MKEDKKILLFDFDGVIVDTIAMIDRHAFRYWNVTEAQQKDWAEGNAHAQQDGTVPEKLDAEQEKITTDFFRDYAGDMPSCPMFDGMRQVIAALADRYTLHIVSSTPTALIREYLERCGMTTFFASVYGMDVSLSKSVKIGMVVTNEQVELRNCLMITDTLGDIREARHAGVEAIGVTWGVHERERLQKGSPWGICEIPAELPNAIDAYFAEV